MVIGSGHALWQVIDTAAVALSHVHADEDKIHPDTHTTHLNADSSIGDAHLQRMHEVYALPLQTTATGRGRDVLQQALATVLPLTTSWTGSTVTFRTANAWFPTMLVHYGRLCAVVRGLVSKVGDCTQYSKGIEWRDS
eukprot:m.1076072 g.1076072  ORF g.1076072 m.1076072 type:complete len:138 (-) comp24247_c0_seq3:1405-1818(-)